MASSVEDKLESSLISYSFNEKLAGVQVHYHVLRLTDSFLVWIGSSAQLSHLAVAVKNNSKGNTAVGTTLIGDVLESSTSESLAVKLAKRSGKQVFVSYNLPSSDPMLYSLVEKRLVDEINSHPAKF